MNQQGSHCWFRKGRFSRRSSLLSVYGSPAIAASEHATGLSPPAFSLMGKIANEAMASDNAFGRIRFQ